MFEQIAKRVSCVRSIAKLEDFNAGFGKNIMVLFDEHRMSCSIKTPFSAGKTALI